MHDIQICNVIWYANICVFLPAAAGLHVVIFFIILIFFSQKLPFTGIHWSSETSETSETSEQASHWASDHLPADLPKGNTCRETCNIGGIPLINIDWLWNINLQGWQHSKVSNSMLISQSSSFLPSVVSSPSLPPSTPPWMWNIFTFVTQVSQYSTWATWFVTVTLYSNRLHIFFCCFLLRCKI